MSVPLAAPKQQGLLHSHVLGARLGAWQEAMRDAQSLRSQIADGYWAWLCPTFFSALHPHLVLKFYLVVPSTSCILQVQTPRKRDDITTRASLISQIFFAYLLNIYYSSKHIGCIHLFTKFKKSLPSGTLPSCGAVTLEPEGFPHCHPSPSTLWVNVVERGQRPCLFENHTHLTSFRFFIHSAFDLFVLKCLLISQGKMKCKTQCNLLQKQFLFISPVPCIC